jgi:hypothetical protein
MKEELNLRPDVFCSLRPAANIPMAVGDGEMGKGTQGRATGVGTLAVAANAVGDDHGIRVFFEGRRVISLREAGTDRLEPATDFDRQVVIGVMRSVCPANGRGPDFKSDSGREGIASNPRAWFRVRTTWPTIQFIGLPPGRGTIRVWS